MHSYQKLYITFTAYDAESIMDKDYCNDVTLQAVLIKGEALIWDS